MRHALLIIICALGLSACTSTHSSRSHSGRAIRSPAMVKAVWVDSWGEGLYTEQECDELLAWCKRFGFNTVIAEVRKIGDAYYRSRLEPVGRNETTGAVLDLDRFDPLEYLARRINSNRDMRLEAWIVANRIWKGDQAPPSTSPPHVLTAHPDWLLRDETGKTATADGSSFLDPSNPAVRLYTASICSDIARRYDVDAIHLDYIRYPGNEWGYGRRSLTRYRADTGATDRPSPDDPQFVDWRAAQVTEEVRAIRSAVRKAAPRCEVTAAVLTWGEIGKGGYRSTGGYRRGLQDWPRWCDLGLIDMLYPMHYKREHDNKWRVDYRRWFAEFEKQRRPGGPRVVVGQGAYLNSVENSMAQIRDALDAGFDGFAIFSYRSPDSGGADREAFGRAVRARTTSGLAVNRSESIERRHRR